MFADAPALPAYAAPECENDVGGRFTLRPPGRFTRPPPAIRGRGGASRLAAGTRQGIDSPQAQRGRTERRAGASQPMGGARLRAVLERANDVGVRCALRPSRDAHRGCRPSAGATTSCGIAAGCAVAHEALGPWRERPPSPRAWYGFGARCVCTPLPLPPGVAPDPSIPGGKAVQRRFRGAGSPARLPPIPRDVGHRRARPKPRRRGPRPPPAQPRRGRSGGGLIGPTVRANHCRPLIARVLSIRAVILAS